MTDHTEPIDVLIFEDHEEEVQRIVNWLDLKRYTYGVSKVFLAPDTQGDEAYVAARGFEWIRREVGRRDPLVVIMDYLLSGPDGLNIFDGADYSNRCKELWPQLGVILVTTGGPFASQALLDEALDCMKKEARDKCTEGTRKNDSIVDFAWIKPWGTATGALDPHVVQRHVEDLIANKCLRPSERPAPLLD